MVETDYKLYKPKTILNTQRHCDGGWFWNKYSAFPYLGCEWGCEYCYWRGEKYNPHKASRDPEVPKYDDPFSEYIKVKEGAPELLRKALKDKPPDLIYLDNYQPVDSKYLYTRKMLEVCHELGFPVFINEKSPTLLRDLDILRKIGEKSYLNVGWSIITTRDDETRKVFEPRAPRISARFSAMRELAKDGITTGTVFMPILPFVYDDEENIEAVIRETKESGGQYVLDAGLTLDGSCKAHFYESLEDYDPNLVDKYEELYSDSDEPAGRAAEVHRLVVKYCQRYEIDPHIRRPVNFYSEKLRINKKISGKFYLKARELQLSGRDKHREWAYRRAAWSLDDLEEGVENLYRERGIDGLIKIKGIGKSLAGRIENILKGDEIERAEDY